MQSSVIIEVKAENVAFHGNTTEEHSLATNSPNILNLDRFHVLISVPLRITDQFGGK